MRIIKVIKKIVMRFGNTGHITLPREYLGKSVYALITDDKSEDKTLKKITHQLDKLINDFSLVKKNTDIYGTEFEIIELKKITKTGKRIKGKSKKLSSKEINRLNN